MHFAYFIADPCETNFHFFFKCQGFLQRLFICYIYFLGRDFNKTSPEELVAINFTEQLLERELKASGLRERVGPQRLMGMRLPQNSSFTGRERAEQEERPPTTPRMVDSNHC